MAKDSKSAPFAGYMASTEKLFEGFTTQAVALAPPESVDVIKVLAGTITSSLGFVLNRLVGAVGVASDEVAELLEGLGAMALVDQLIETLDNATSPPDLAAVGVVLPIIKKIIRFVVLVTETKPGFDLDKVLEFIDELATTIMDLVSPKGAEAMHRSEIRFLEAQVQLDRLAAVRENLIDVSGA